MKFYSYFFSGQAPEPTKEHIEKEQKIIQDSTKMILENINESISTFYPSTSLNSISNSESLEKNN